MTRPSVPNGIGALITAEALAALRRQAVTARAGERRVKPASFS
jgi:hypothetical protein